MLGSFEHSHALPNLGGTPDRKVFYFFFFFFFFFFFLFCFSVNINFISDSDKKYFSFPSFPIDRFVRDVKLVIHLNLLLG
jgi:hypothetical protein